MVLTDPYTSKFTLHVFVSIQKITPGNKNNEANLRLRRQFLDTLKHFYLFICVFLTALSVARQDSVEWKDDNRIIPWKGSGWK
jgi:hypothetical protein